MSDSRVRALILAVLAVGSAALAALAAFWPQWIEEILGVEPDQGSGALEWALPLGLLVVAAFLAVAARSSWRSRAALEQGS